MPSITSDSTKSSDRERRRAAEGVADQLQQRTLNTMQNTIMKCFAGRPFLIHGVARDEGPSALF
jgi:hypothetical protein